MNTQWQANDSDRAATTSQLIDRLSWRSAADSKAKVINILLSALIVSLKEPLTDLIICCGTIAAKCDKLMMTNFAIELLEGLKIIHQQRKILNGVKKVHLLKSN